MREIQTMRTPGTSARRAIFALRQCLLAQRRLPPASAAILLAALFPCPFQAHAVTAAGDQSQAPKSGPVSPVNDAIETVVIEKIDGRTLSTDKTTYPIHERCRFYIRVGNRVRKVEGTAAFAGKSAQIKLRDGAVRWVVINAK
ncbi:MAG: hypothetical protein U9Q81_20390 [Pseudomonadota bacterium]|nr:hypothetical protein [Pseudomonadota bacterium]